jgi:hypothetical protein
MSDFAKESLVAAAGVDPWALRDKFTAGDPEEIYAMARAFNMAAGQQGEAVELTTRGLETAGDGYIVNNATPIDVNAEVAATSRSLGNNGEKLGQIAKILSDTASDLITRTNTANIKIVEMEGAVNGIIGEWNEFWRLSHHDPDMQRDMASFREPYVQRAVQKIKDYGTPIKQSVTDYETALSGHLKAMADLGYIPSDALDEGPGDVNIPDPRTAAAGTYDATKITDPAAARAAFAQNTAYLDLLNGKQRSGIPLTDAETEWLKQYYGELVPHFGEIKEWADEQTGTDPGDRPDRNNPATQLVSRVGDGFLNLSRNVPYDELPQSARDILASNLGTTDADDQMGLWATPGERHIGDEWPPRTDPALLRAAGFVGLLNDYSSPDVAPSDNLASHMKDAALRWKHQINVMYTNYKADYPIAHAYGYDGPELSAADWNRLMPDELASDALGVTARNREFSNNWIVNNAAERREVMGMNWQSGQGAADVLLSASVRGPGLTDEQAARGGLAIVQDASTDYNGLATRANTAVKAAITNVGLTYIDSFAQYNTGQNGVTTLTLPDGTHISGFTMDANTRDNFLKFVAASDNGDYQMFREGTLERGKEYLQSVMAQGHTDPNDPVYQRALRDAVRLTSGADAAAAGVLVDMAREGANDNAVQQKADALAYAQAMSDYNSTNGTVNGVKAVFRVAGLITLPTGAGLAVNAGNAALYTMLDAVWKPPPAPDLGSNILNLDQYVANLADGHVAQDAAESQVQHNIATMLVNAGAESGHPIIDPATGQPVRVDGDGQYPEQVVSGIYNGVDNYTVDLGRQRINDLVSTQNDPSGHGGGYSTQFSTSVTGGTQNQVGSLGDSGGNWSNTDDQYRIYYGDETRYQYHAPTTWDGAYQDRQVPDNDGDTRTGAPSVPAAG